MFEAAHHCAASWGRTAGAEKRDVQRLSSRMRAHRKAARSCTSAAAGAEASGLERPARSGAIPTLEARAVCGCVRKEPATGRTGQERRTPLTIQARRSIGARGGQRQRERPRHRDEAPWVDWRINAMQDEGRRAREADAVSPSARLDRSSRVRGGRVRVPQRTEAGQMLSRRRRSRGNAHALS